MLLYLFDQTPLHLLNFQRFGCQWRSLKADICFKITFVKWCFHTKAHLVFHWTLFGQVAWESSHPRLCCPKPESCCLKKFYWVYKKRRLCSQGGKKCVIFRKERGNDRKYVCCLQATKPSNNNFFSLSWVLQEVSLLVTCWRVKMNKKSKSWNWVKRKTQFLMIKSKEVKKQTYQGFLQDQLRFVKK